MTPLVRPAEGLALPHLGGEALQQLIRTDDVLVDGRRHFYFGVDPVVDPIGRDRLGEAPVGQLPQPEQNAAMPGQFPGECLQHLGYGALPVGRLPQQPRQPQGRDGAAAIGVPFGFSDVSVLH